MSAVRESTRILSALLEPDGTIRVTVLYPDSIQPSSATIEPIESTIRAAGRDTRHIDLIFGTDCDRHLRLIIAMHVDALAFEREQARSRRHLRCG